mmetsp:Transcript_23063/g.53363  ORF Transcript_23063/g.53363 Transcript_23063/m.53363 type:complete len:218 (-) Transcript_23063:885-1538(-)
MQPKTPRSHALGGRSHRFRQEGQWRPFPSLHGPCSDHGLLVLQRCLRVVTSWRSDHAVPFFVLLGEGEIHLHQLLAELSGDFRMGPDREVDHRESVAFEGFDLMGRVAIEHCQVLCDVQCHPLLVGQFWNLGRSVVLWPEHQLASCELPERLYHGGPEVVAVAVAPRGIVAVQVDGSEVEVLHLPGHVVPEPSGDDLRDVWVLTRVAVHEEIPKPVP